MPNSLMSQIVEKEAGQEEFWTFRDWETSHTLLAASANGILNVGNVKLRIFLRPYEETIVIEGRTHINSRYSLWTELLSKHKVDVLLKILTVVDARNSQGFRDYKTQESKVFLEKNMDGKKVEKEICKDFILMRGWTVLSDVSGSRKSFFHNYSLKYKFEADEVIIGIKATTQQLKQTAY